MRFSICMVARNAQKTILYAINSILNQSFRDFELIIIDDWSEDSTYNIVDNIIDSRIKLFHSSNSGLLKARIQAIKKASGEYILTVDSDDALVDGALSYIDEILKQKRVDILQYKGIKVLETGKKIEIPSLFQNMQLLGKKDIKNITESLLVCDDFSTLWNKAIKRKCIDIRKLETLPNLSIGEDNIILLFTFPNANSYCYTSKIFYLYSLNGGITKKFRRDSFSNQKERISCKRCAVEYAGFDIETYDKVLNIALIEVVSKVCAFFPTIVDSDYRSKEIFYDCMDEIRSDSYFWDIYKKHKNAVSILYRIPLWLVKKHMYCIVLRIKNMSAKLRK